MGVVYEAHDTQRDMTVALKTLRTIDANLLYHFKNEFRALADLSHPNLCTLYELFQDEGSWYFTMELVEGIDFLSWIRPEASPSPSPSPEGTPAAVAGTQLEFGRAAGGTMLEYGAAATPRATTPVPTRVADGSGRRDYDETRLRDALVQLSAGLEALHEAGKVHRDIKPSNILVTRDGRVVIMDFGLVADDAMLAEFMSARMIAGTPTFMAPEQGVPGAEVGPSADWYAVGVMLYEILTDQLPFGGATLQELLAAKRTPPPMPSQVAFGAPPDLSELCHRMLSPDPAARPTGREVLQRLGGRVTMPSIGSTRDVFVGRRAELGTLHTALADSRSAAVTVFVEGASGLGKTALVRRFLDEVSDSGTLILRGRCYAEETVPYKAFDGIVDALTRYLVQLAPHQVVSLLPPSTALAARLFPVLRRIPVFASATTHDPSVAAQEMRARAFVAVTELFARIAASRPLVVFVDDLQWADPDSLLLLRELLHEGTAPPLALIASIRTPDGRSELAEQLARSIQVSPRRVILSPLPPDDAAMLVDRLLPPGTISVDRRRDIAREAAGHPLFLAELAHHFQLHADTDLTTRLDEALWQRAMALEHDARHLLQLIAVAGTPVDLKTIADAADLSPTRAAPLAAALRGARFVKTSITSAGHSLVEPYHDRVREAIVTRLERSQFAALSSHLAHAMLDAGMGDTAPELVVRHLFAAGDPARGRDLAERAAERALAALAFDRAAEFLRAALAAGPRDATHARSLQLALADALASGGRGGEAAEAFLAAAALSDREARLDCRRHAADQLLVSGHVDRGLTELSSVLDQLGERIPASSREALASMETERAQIDAAPVVLRERSLADIAPDLLRKLDVYQSTSLGLLLVDNVRGADYQARAVRLAIAAGEPRRLLRALVFEAIYRAQESAAGRERAAELLSSAADIARTHGGDPWMTAYLVLGDAWLAYYHGRFRHAVELYKDAGTRFRGLPGVAWEQNMIMIHRLRATDYQGAWGELRALYDQYLRDAQRRDDRYVEASITRWFNVLWLAHDRPDLAGSDLDRRVWTPPDDDHYHLQHFLELRARVELALYRGDGASQGSWARPGLEAADRSLLLRIQIARAIADWLLGRIAACEGDVAETERCARRLEEQDINYARIWGGLLVGAALARRGDTGGAIARLEDLAKYADDNDFPLCAAIARLRAGQLRGVAGASQVETARAWMTGQDIRNPLRMCDVFAPGFPT